jgi:hypothetical protein
VPSRADCAVLYAAAFSVRCGRRPSGSTWLVPAQCGS